MTYFGDLDSRGNPVDPKVCTTCGGAGVEYSGVEHMGQREVIGCGDCLGTGYDDPLKEIERLRTVLDIMRNESMQADRYASEVEGDEPDTPRVPELYDRVLAGLLSTQWPLSHMHPDRAIHLAIFVNDHPELAAEYMKSLRERCEQDDIDAVERSAAILARIAPGTAGHHMAEAHLARLKAAQ